MPQIRTFAAAAAATLALTGAAACGGGGENDVDDASRTTTNEAPLNQDTPNADPQQGETTPAPTDSPEAGG